MVVSLGTKRSSSKGVKSFIKKPAVKKLISEYSKKTKQKKAGVNEMIILLWELYGGDEKKVFDSLKRILGKLSGSKEFFGFLTRLKLAPEKKM